MDRLVPTWRLLRSLPLEPETLVPLERVLKQRLAILEMDVRALRYTELQDLLGEAGEIAAHGVGAPMAKILVRQPEGNLLVVAAHGLKPGMIGQVAIPADVTNPAGECLLEQRVVCIRDLGQESSYTLPAILTEHAVTSTINVPIIVKTGAYGVLEADATEPRGFDALDQSFLIGIAGIIGEGVERVRREGSLSRAISARRVLLREHHHRVRNNYQVLIGALARHAREAGTPESRDRFRAMERRLFAMASVYDHLIGSAEARTVILQDYLSSLCDGLREFYALNERGVTLAFSRTESTSVDIELATALGIVVNELVANSVEHAFGEPGGQISVGTVVDKDGLCVYVSDTGAGYRAPAEETIGLTTVRRLVSQIDAALDVTSDGGTTWKICLPPERLTVLRPFGGAKPLRRLRNSLKKTGTQ
jgi:two-component sensor histidine kinase